MVYYQPNDQVIKLVGTYAHRFGGICSSGSSWSKRVIEDLNQQFDPSCFGHFATLWLWKYSLFKYNRNILFWIIMCIFWNFCHIWTYPICSCCTFKPALQHTIHILSKWNCYYVRFQTNWQNLCLLLEYWIDFGMYRSKLYYIWTNIAHPLILNCSQTFS